MLLHTKINNMLNEAPDFVQEIVFAAVSVSVAKRLANFGSESKASNNWAFRRYDETALKIFDVFKLLDD